MTRISDAVGPGSVRHIRRPLHGLAVIDGCSLLTDLHPATATDDDEETQVGTGLWADDGAPRQRQLGHPCPWITPDGLVGHALRADRRGASPETGTETQDVHVA